MLASMDTVATIFLVCGLVLIGASEPDSIDLLLLNQRLRQQRPLGVELANLSNVPIENRNLEEVGCIADLTHWFEGIKNRDFWALKSKLVQLIFFININKYS